MQYRAFGKTGASVSALGFGTMRMPVTDGKAMGPNIDEEASVKMIRAAIDRGVNYIDTAYIYHGGNSERMLAKALADGYRERVYLADKSPVWLINSEEDFDRILDEQLEKCNTEYFDFYLLHSITKTTFDNKIKKFGLVEKIKAAKAAGKIRHIGFSFHDQLPVFEEMLNYTDAWEFCLIQLNYAGTEYQAGLEGLRMAAERGLGVLIMEPLLGGKLANLSPRMAAEISKEKPPVEWALDWLWNLPEVGVILSGMSTAEQVEQNLAYANAGGVGKLTEEDLAMLARVERVYLEETKIPCTACSYCMPCPQGIDIPALFDAYNSVVSSSKAVAVRKYAQIETPASACVQCGACEAHCPQHLEIRKTMDMLEDYFE